MTWGEHGDSCEVLKAMGSVSPVCSWRLNLGMKRECPVREGQWRREEALAEAWA